MVGKPYFFVAVFPFFYTAAGKSCIAFFCFFDINIIDPFRFIFRFKSVIGNANALCIVDIICPASVASE